jgi:putative inorganic carbon (HCO3(-)) transporter
MMQSKNSVAAAAAASAGTVRSVGSAADSDDVAKTRYLYWWLLVVLIFEYARPGSFVPPLDVLKLNTLLPLSLFVLTLFAKGLRPFPEIFRDPIARWMTFYIMLMFLSIFTAEVSLYSYELFQGALGYFFFFLIIARVATTEQRIVGVYMTLVLAHLFLVIANPNLILSPESRSYVQGGTFLGDGNDFALSVCILLAPTLYAALNGPTRARRLIYWGFVAILFLCVVGTQSRGGTLAAGAVLALLWYGSQRKFQGLLGLGIVVLAVLAYAPSVYFERMGTITDYENESSAQGRIIAWKAGFKMAVDHPVFGAGTGNFPTEFGSKYATPGFPWMTAHSMYFLVMGELGFTGLITLGSILLGSFLSSMLLRRRILRSIQPGAPDPERARRAQFLLMLSGSMLAFMVAGAFLSVAYYPHVFVVPALLLAARAVTRSELGLVESREPAQRPALRPSSLSTGSR